MSTAQAIIRSNVEFTIRDVRSGLERCVRSRNLVTTSGLQLIRDLIGGTGLRPSHVGLGTDNTAPAATDTALGSEQYRAEVTRRDPSSNSIQFQLYVPTSEGNGHTYEEAALLQTGLQNGSPGDPATLLARTTFSPILKTASVEITALWSITLAAV